MNEIVLTDTAQEQLSALEKDRSRKNIEKAVKKTLALMQHNLRHPSLNTHEFTSLKGPNGEKVFEAYAQHSTPGAYRVFWYYGPRKNQISVAAITPHP